MRVQTEEWRRFIPGSRMYKGKKTLFWNGEILYDDDEEEFLVYDEEEQHSWEVIIVLPGVEVIPRDTFNGCEDIETVIMSDAVRRIEAYAFQDCKSLVFVKLSRNLEYIGNGTFESCESLTSIFIPPSCREIDDFAFWGCGKLIILVVPQHTQLGIEVIGNTELIKISPFRYYRLVGYGDPLETHGNEEANEWIKTHHTDNEFSLHRACTSYNPLDEVLFNIVKRQGLKAFKKSDRVGVTASHYLSENPFADVEEHKIIKRYILDMMGEVI